MTMTHRKLTKENMQYTPIFSGFKCILVQVPWNVYLWGSNCGSSSHTRVYLVTLEVDTWVARQGTPTVYMPILPSYHISNETDSHTAQ